MMARLTLLVIGLVTYSCLSAQQSAYLDHRADPTWAVIVPRGDTVEIDFTTSEGTWMSVDISSDGQWIVFDLLGQIYRVRSAGGEAECLTQDSGIALNFHPRYSPDGQSIVFVSDRNGQNNLWRMNADGSEPEVLFEDPVSRFTSPVWMPDGTAIVAVREFPTYSMHRRSARIWSIPLGQPSRKPVELVGQVSGVQSYWPSVTADGRYVYYMQSTFAEPLHGMQRYQHIRRLELATGRTELVTVPEGKEWYKTEGATELAPELSPDGQWLAFARRIDGAILTWRGHEMRGRTALWLRHLASGEERLLADPITFDMQNAHGMKNLRVLPGYAWDNESRSLVYSQGGAIKRVWLNDGHVEKIPFTAHVRRTASQQARSEHDISDAPFEVKYIRWPDISPDGKVVVFEAAGWIWKKELPAGIPQKLLNTHSGAKPRAVAGMHQFMPAISPDGRNVVFVSWDDHALGQVWRVPLAGGKARQVTRHAARYLYPSWSTDGETITALRSTGINAQGLAGGAIARYDHVAIDTRGNERLIQAPAPRLVSHPGPDDRLFQLEQRAAVDVQPFLAQGITPPDSHSILLSFNPESPAARTEHIRFPAASEAAPSHDGQWVAFSEDKNVYLTTLQHGTAVYQPDRPLVWTGPDSPFEVVKEDPRLEVKRLSTAGGGYIRWREDGTLVFASANRIHIYDPATGQQQIIDAGLLLDRPIPEGSIALDNTRIITLDHDRVIERGTIIINGSRIQCVGECDPSTADRVIDLEGKTVIPGWVDVHAHGYYFAERPVIGTQLPPTSLYLAYGITTALDPSANSSGVFPIAEMIRAGRMPGPRTFTTGESLMPQSPLTGPSDYVAAEGMIQRLADQGAISIKIYLAPRRDQRQMYAEAARKFGLSVTNEGADFTYNVGSMLDGNTGFEHPMHQLPIWNDAITFFAQTRAVYSPTLIVAGASTWMEDYFQSRADLWNDQKMRRFMPWRRLTQLVNHTTRPKSEYGFPMMVEAVGDLIDAGGFGAIGGHGQTWGLDGHWEVWGYSEALEPLEALRMASLGGAQMAGLEDDLGSIETGKLADLVILNANPLEDIRHTTRIEYVMKGGVLYDDDTLNQVWPTAVETRPPAWVRDDVFRDDARPIEQ
jgi:Tol biopolymer transport system component